MYRELTFLAFILALALTATARADQIRRGRESAFDYWKDGAMFILEKPLPKPGKDSMLVFQGGHVVDGPRVSGAPMCMVTLGKPYEDSKPRLTLLERSGGKWVSRTVWLFGQSGIRAMLCASETGALGVADIRRALGSFIELGVSPWDRADAGLADSTVANDAFDAKSLAPSSDAEQPSAPVSGGVREAL